MELRHIRYFMAVAEEASVTRAALRLGIAQPPLSQQIRQLEREVGAPLFERLSRGVALTEAGRRFLQDARDILERVNQAISNARLAALGELGTIRIGFTSSASFHPFVTGAIRAYRSAYPDVKAELVEDNTAHLLAGLRTARVDVAFLRPADGELAGLPHWPLFQEDMLVALPADHHLARHASVSLESLREELFILYPRANGRAMHDAITGACRAAGFDPKAGQGAPQMTSTINLVATGIGVSIVPASMAQLSAQGVTYKDIEGPAPRATMVLAAQIAEPLRAAQNFHALVLHRLRGQAA